jgi:acyl-coenzyme A synthetase/AMP-(fatty) acid ligase
LDWPRRFAAFLAETEATQVQGVPSIWRALMRHEPGLLADLDRLRLIVFSGEDFPLSELRELQRLLPGRRIVNCYGATETMAASITDVPDPIPPTLERLSIGYAHPGAEMSIFDKEGRPITTPGVGGEIYLRGPTLFTGYWGNPEATSMALVPDPLNPATGQRVFRTGDWAILGEKGELYFHDRVDSQVQIRGNRVELGEVERRMLELPGVASVAAVLRPTAGGESELSVFVVPKPGAPNLDLVTVRAFCLETLPSYMAPVQLHTFAELPVTANGKVDRAALAAS